jgi:2-polyprenyl-3-methyl-5-hydroxy-6-metoxy-1,4-benzoquinol methylase
MKESFDKKWDEVYTNGQQLNEFPYTDLVSFYYNKFKKNTEKLNILEVGCGAGNNLEFLAEMGHTVYGVDASEKVIEYAKKKFRQKNLTGNFSVNKFTKLPFEENFFDLILNRAAICHTDIISADIALKECNRVMKNTGIFYSTFFTSFNTFKANMIDFGYYNSFEDGFTDVGALKFYNIFEIIKIFEKNNFNITNLYLTEKKDMKNIPTKVNSEWIIHSKKNNT